MKKIIVSISIILSLQTILAQTIAYTDSLCYELNGVVKLKVQNSERLSFKRCRNELNYQIEKFENSDWKQTQYACCNCQLDLPGRI